MKTRLFPTLFYYTVNESWKNQKTFQLYRKVAPIMIRHLSSEGWTCEGTYAKDWGPTSVFWPRPSAYSAGGSEKDDSRGCCGRSSLSTAHASVAPYCFQLQKEVTITTVGYQMAGLSSRGLLVHREDHHLSWLPLLLHF